MAPWTLGRVRIPKLHDFPLFRTSRIMAKPAHNPAAQRMRLRRRCVSLTCIFMFTHTDLLIDFRCYCSLA